MEIIYREAVPEDAQALLDFFKVVGSESDNLSFGAEGIPFTVEQEQQFLASLLKNPNERILLALDGKNIVGNSTINRSTNPRFYHRCSFAITIQKSHWGQGIGSELMKRQTAFARETGVEIMELEVRADNERAMALYKKFCFVPFGTYPRFFKFGDEYFDAVYMTKSL